ncbi:MAG: N-acetylmuramoyl-L-alanine amidase [Treponema sp.]|jgi:N-acetylmuramoyl-L-alanine amidase|nr:N-acetylmuramoyl-L-alanine amidase [Treponema sp.]
MKKLLVLKLIFLFILLIPNPQSPVPSPHSLFALSLDETLTAINAISQSSGQSGARFRYDPFFRNGVFNMGDHYGAFTVAAKEGETGFLALNNQELFNVPLPYNANGALVFPDGFVDTLKSAFGRLHENDASKFRIAAIIIDPGHGGRDSGAIGNITVNRRTTQVFEKDIVLKVALQLRDLLITSYPDKKILMTRDRDIFRTLDERAEMANAVTVKDNEAVIFISIHANWGANPNARGYEVWHITSGYRRSLISPSQHNYSADITAILNAMMEEEFTTESILLADWILHGFGQAFGNTLPSRGRKANDWFVVRNSRMPAVLVELGFLSNQQDIALMTSDEGLQKLTRSLYNGITNFIGIFERK